MAIVYIAFRPNIPDRYLPIEEIIDEDFAVATFCYNDVAADREDNFTEGLAGLLKKGDERAGTHFHSRYDWLRFMEFMKRHRIV